MYVAYGCLSACLREREGEGESVFGKNMARTEREVGSPNENALATVVRYLARPIALYRLLHSWFGSDFAFRSSDDSEQRGINW